MEIRNITIVQNKNAGRVTLQTGIETLGELKRLLQSNSINYDGMAFYEGISKTELKQDESQLPRSLNYRTKTGEQVVTNDLVIMLTVANKKIDSGSNIQ